MRAPQAPDECYIRSRIRYIVLLRHQSRAFELTSKLVFEMTYACEYHRNPMGICRCDRLFILNGAAWLNDCCNSCFCSKLYSVSHWEKCIRSKYCTFCLLSCLLDCNTSCPYTIHLTSTNANRHIAFSKNDSIRFNMLNDLPSE